MDQLPNGKKGETFLRPLLSASLTLRREQRYTITASSYSAVSSCERTEGGCVDGVEGLMKLHLLRTDLPSGVRALPSPRLRLSSPRQRLKARRGRPKVSTLLCYENWCRRENRQLFFFSFGQDNNAKEMVRGSCVHYVKVASTEKEKSRHTRIVSREVGHQADTDSAARMRWPAKVRCITRL